MKRLVFLIIFLLSIGIVHAEFSQSNGVQWLNNNLVCSRASIEEIAFSTIVLNSNECLNELKINRIDSSGCFPKNNCNTKDTALATLTLGAKNQQITKQIEYLQNRLIGATGSVESQWIIQIVSSGAGECVISYDGSGDDGYTVNFNENGEITPNGGSWIGFNSLTGFEFNSAIEEINVDCRDLSGVSKISIIKNVDSTFEIIEESNSNNVDFKINNGCYSASADSNSCNPDATFYASWVLNELDKSLATKSYLTSNANSDFYYSMLAKIDSSYLPGLVEKQKNTGSFNSNVRDTSFAIYSLKGQSLYETEISDATDWVESQQEESGKIGTGILDTAVSLYLIYSNINYPGVGSGDNEDESGPGCTTDFQCGEGQECVSGSCQPITNACINDGICTASEYLLTNCGDCFGCGDEYCSPLENEISCAIDCKEEPICDNDGFCDLNENKLNCPQDCPQDDGNGGDSGGSQSLCGNGNCDLGESNSCPNDCQADEGKSYWWLWLIIIILVIGAAVFFIIPKIKKGGKDNEDKHSYLQGKMPSFNQQPQRTQIRRHSKDQAMESELDESIKEAQELLRSKK